jgi:hypothetical protein
MMSNSLLSQTRTLRRVMRGEVFITRVKGVGMVLLVVASTVGYKEVKSKATGYLAMRLYSK